MAKEKYVYVAGPVSKGSFSDCSRWRDKAKFHLDNLDGKFKVLDPLRGKECTANEKYLLPSGYTGNASDHVIFETCIWDIRRCDVVLANLSEAKVVSIGTMFEIAWAYSLGKYIVVVMGDSDSDLHNHAFVKEAASIILPNLEEAMEYIEEIVI